MKARNSSVIGCRERKKTADGENVFFKALLKLFVNIEMLFMADLLSSGLHEKVMTCYIIMLYYFK